MEAILRFLLTVVRQGTQCRFPTRLQSLKVRRRRPMATRAGSDGNASVKTQRQLGTGALAAAPSRGEWDREFETCHD